MLDSIFLNSENFFILTWCENSINFLDSLWFINGCFKHILPHYIVFFCSFLVMNPTISNRHPAIFKLLLIKMYSIEISSHIIKKIFIPFDLIDGFLYLRHITKWTSLVSIYHINRSFKIGGYKKHKSLHSTRWGE